MTKDRANIETVLPLLPLQKALLLQRGRTDADDPGLLHVQCTLRGPLDETRLRRAWETVVGWHPALRMSTHARDAGDPLAVAWRRVDLPWTTEDWRDRAADGHADELARWLETDGARGLELDHAPVMRVTTIRTADDVCEVVWTCHHLFLDGWSAAIVLEDVLAVYRQLTADGTAPPAPSVAAFGAYYTWTRERDDAAAEVFWRDRLAGFAGAPALRLDAAGDGAAGRAGHAAFEIMLDDALPPAVQAAAARLALTPNAFVQGAWGLVLAALFATDDVAFGTTVAGRSAGIGGLERMVGLFSNVVPVRVRVDDEAVAGDWLRGLRDEQFQMQPFEHAALADVHAWSDVPGRRALFDTFVVVENFPARGGAAAEGDLVLSGFRSSLTSSFPLTLAVVPGARWRVHAQYDEARLREEDVRALVEVFAAAVSALARRPECAVGELRRELDTAALVALAPAADAPAGVDRAPAEHRAPRDEVELRLAAIWEEQLGVSGIGVDDDYFALGGTSLAAVRLFARIEAAFDRTLPISTLLAGPTIAHLASVLRGTEASAPAWKCLVPIQTSGSRPPLACVHAGGAHVLFYRDLALRLGPDQPVYGLEPAGLDGSEPPLTTIGAMADRYVDELRAARPEGPYRLVGYCIGGAVCLEMARRLEAQGQAVDLFVVIDSGLAPPDARALPPVATARKMLVRRGVGAVASGVARRLTRPVHQRLRIALGGPQVRRRVYQDRAERACRLAFLSYDASPCHAPILLIRSTEYLRQEAKEWHLEWRKYTSRLDVAVVEAGHETILLEPEVAAVARLLHERLQGA